MKDKHDNQTIDIFESLPLSAIADDKDSSSESNSEPFIDDETLVYGLQQVNVPQAITDGSISKYEMTEVWKQYCKLRFMMDIVEVKYKGKFRP